MKIKILQKLSQRAKIIMSKSTDPIHDIAHVKRVLHNAKKIMQDMDLSRRERQSVELACLWHDVGRVITNRPSFVWMIFFDDSISAFMLWRETSRLRLFSRTSGLAGRIILCKSLGTGKIFAKLFLSKKTRRLLDIVKDADTLDILHTERIKKAIKAIENNTMPIITYRLITWYSTRLKTIKIKTNAAKKILQEIITQLIIWIQKVEISLWHANKLGIKWCQEMQTRLNKLQLLFNNFEIKNTISITTS